MAFFQKLAVFFQSLLYPSSPENLQRQAVKKVEGELRMIAPSLYKSGLVQIEFAEVLRVLYLNTSPIFEILSDTICSPELDVSRHFTEQLLITGFSDESFELLESLSYENRKNGAMEAQSISRYFETDHRNFEKIVKELNTPEFEKIDFTLDKVTQLSDICKFSYVTALRLFDANFSVQDGYEPDFQPIPPDLLENSLMDLYYVISDMDVTNSLYNAVIALAKLKFGGTLPERMAERLKSNFKKIQSITKRILKKDVLICLIRIAKKSTDFIPEKAIYKGDARQKYVNFLETKFRVDESRIKTEIQDAKVNHDIKQVFGDAKLTAVKGYSTELDAQLRQSTPFAFLWITPMQLLKNFLTMFYENHVKPLLNDIVIEGFFNNAAYKSDFSSAVFACNESLERIGVFEAKFLRGNEHDESNIISLIRDSHKDPAFESTLKNSIDKINKQAKEVIQMETTNIFQLYKKINDVLLESKKPSSEVITNLKVLMISSRNRDNSDFMESQNSKWKIFLETMKNYVIIGNIEKK
jgi:flagellar hook-basal body complex protein FliE